MFFLKHGVEYRVMKRGRKLPLPPPPFASGATVSSLQTPMRALFDFSYSRSRWWRPQTRPRIALCLDYDPWFSAYQPPFVKVWLRASPVSTIS